MTDSLKALDIVLAKLHDEPTQSPIRALVVASGLSQRAFAAAMEIPQRTVEDWCRGVRKCPDYVVSLIAYNLANEGMIKAQS